jgi:hypothetical protein
MRKPRTILPLLSLAATMMSAPATMATGTDDGDGHGQHGGRQMEKPPAVKEQKSGGHEDHARHDAGARGGHPREAGSYVAGAEVGLTPLDVIPPSGRAREAGSDGRYHMAPTSREADLATLCAQATRGLIMLDNATWEKCGGKPEGASKGPGYYPAIPPWNTPGTGEAKQQTGHMGH